METTHTLITLEGFLGRTPETRLTTTRTIQRTVHRRESFVFEHGGKAIREEYDLYEEAIEVEYETTPREYTTLSVATHDRTGRTRWHRVIAWNTDRQLPILRYCRKGDRVRITGHRTSFETQDGRTVEQIELIDLEIIRPKPRNVYDHSLFGDITRAVAGG